MTVLCSQANRLSRIAEVLGTLGLSLMAVVLCWQVFARYALNASPAWSEQLALVLTQWFVLLGAAVGIWQEFHIRITEFVDRLPQTYRNTIAFVVELVNALFAVLLIWQGSALTLRTWDHQVPTLSLTQGMVYATLPLTGLLILLFVSVRISSRRGS